MLGPAPVVDFDGTVARLEVAWAALREAAGVRRIDELWARGAPDAWADVTRAEEAAATVAAPVTAIITHLEAARAVAVLTSNAEASVAAFLARFPAVGRRVVAVVGRETLGGPKTDFDVYARGYQRCVDATASARGDGPVVYVGDMEYELEFARRLGATAIAVSTLESA
jgi:phosphoglycolate phosphatase-like HAD superfamily hydrolase